MAGINLTNQEKKQLYRSNYLIGKIPVDAQPWAIYHNERGKEFRLPADAYSIMNYRGRGFSLGKAPEELKERFRDQPVERPEMQYIEQGAAAGEETSNELISLVRSLMDEVRQLREERDVAKLPISESARSSSVLLLPAPKPVEPKQLRLL